MVADCPGLEQSHEAGAAQDVGVYPQHFRSVVFRYYVLHRWPPGLAAGRKMPWELIRSAFRRDYFNLLRLSAFPNAEYRASDILHNAFRRLNAFFQKV
jgi:hypothetical protein